MLERQEVLLDHRLLLERWAGRATVDEVKQALGDQVGNPDFSEVRFILSDERRVEDFDFAASDIREFAKEAASSLEAYEGKRWAFVIDATRTTALVMLFRSLLESEIEVQVFSTLESALTWLGVPRQTFEYVMDREDESV